MGKKKKATIPATSGAQPPALKIGSRVRFGDGTGGRITWANAADLYRHPVPAEVQNDPNAF